MTLKTRLWIPPVLILVLGALFETYFFYITSSGKFLPPDYAGNVSALDEAAKKLIEVQTSYSMWLQTMAVAVLGGVFAIRLREPKDQRVLSMPALMACSFMFLSLYSAHLFQSGMMLALSEGPVKRIDSELIAFPLTAQFWNLIFGVGTIAFWLLRPSRKLQMGVVVLLAGSGAVCRAQQPDSFSACVLNWQTESGMLRDAEASKTAGRLIDRLAHKAGFTPDKTSLCPYSRGIMNTVRTNSIRLSGRDTPKDLNEYVRRLEGEASASGLGFDEFLQNLVERSRAWLAPSGRIEVRSTKGTKYISVDSQPAVYRNLDWVYTPGQHVIEVRENLAVVFRRTVSLVRGGEIVVDLDKEVAGSGGPSK